jgi:hypothetical protein
MRTIHSATHVRMADYVRANPDAAQFLYLFEGIPAIKRLFAKLRRTGSLNEEETTFVMERRAAWKERAARRVPDPRVIAPKQSNEPVG